MALISKSLWLFIYGYKTEHSKIEDLKPSESCWPFYSSKWSLQSFTKCCSTQQHLPAPLINLGMCFIPACWNLSPHKEENNQPETTLQIFAVDEDIIGMDFKCFCPTAVTKERSLVILWARERKKILSRLCVSLSLQRITSLLGCYSLKGFLTIVTSS